MTPTQDQTVALTADIVIAFVSHNTIAAQYIAQLITDTHGALVKLGQPEASPEPERMPAVAIRASVKPDHIICLECGMKAKMLKRHLRTAHGLDESAYRTRWNLPFSYPLTAPNYSERRRSLALEHGLGRKAEAK